MVAGEGTPFPLSAFGEFDMTESGVFHAGELEIQRRAGASDVAARNGGIVRNQIVSGAIPFLARQSMIVVGREDRSGQLWTTMLFGEPGFITAPEPAELVIDLGSAFDDPDDPALSNVIANDRLGLVAIELESRRRLRVNGRLTEAGERRLRLQVEESYPNCPKYINRRKLEVASTTEQDSRRTVREGIDLDDPELRATLTDADTFFVASIHPERGLDASHRGGEPGFLEIDGNLITVPDFKGNGMFNTLGNFAADPRAAVVIPDFERGLLLQITGEARVRGDGQGPERSWQFEAERWRLAAMPSGVSWSNFADERAPASPSYET